MGNVSGLLIYDGSPSRPKESNKKAVIANWSSVAIGLGMTYRAMGGGIPLYLKA